MAQGKQANCTSFFGSHLHLQHISCVQYDVMRQVFGLKTASNTLKASSEEYKKDLPVHMKCREVQIILLVKVKYDVMRQTFDLKTVSNSLCMGI